MEQTKMVRTIQPSTFDALLQEYPDVVPEKIRILDKQRYEMIPASVREREGSPHLTKEEVTTLVDWKLSHGKFRPTLKSLVRQNTDEAVVEMTKDAFSVFRNSPDTVKASLTTLTKLRGIGPATASLILSVYDPETAPFFSDELFRWAHFEEGSGKGWDRGIKYNVKEYLGLFDKIVQLRTRLETESEREIAAVDAEKVAYVLAKRGDAVGEVEVRPAESGPRKRKAALSETLDQEVDTPKRTRPARQSKTKKVVQG